MWFEKIPAMIGVLFVLLAGCSSKRLVVSTDAAVDKEAGGSNLPDVAGGHDDLPAGETGSETGTDATVDSGGVVPRQEVGDIDATETGARDMADAGADEAGTAIETGRVVDTGQPEVCTGIVCAVDFPCPPDRVSSCFHGNPKVILTYATVGCAEICGTPCCSGAQCRSKTQDCPAGTACAYPSPPTTASGTKAACFDEAKTCGGVDNKPCPAGQYCEHFETLCSGSSCPSSASVCSEVAAGILGTCMPKRDSSQCDITSPLCGCDGQTYQNECARQIANAALAHAGACP
jgi:hypothetical protein